MKTLKYFLCIATLVLTLSSTLSANVKIDDIKKDNKAITNLIKVVKVGDLPELKKMIADDIDVNSTTKTGATALMIAAKYGNKHIVKELLKNGAKVEKTNKSGLTAYHFAVAYGHYDVADYLKRRM